MPYYKSLDLIAMAADAFDNGDLPTCSRLMTEALSTPDRAQALEEMLANNEKYSPESLTASDIGVVFAQPGEDLRIAPGENQRRLSQEDAGPPEGDKPVNASEEAESQECSADSRGLTATEARTMTRRIAAKRAAARYFKSAADDQPEQNANAGS